MRLPDPSLDLQPGNKVVVFVHHLVPGLYAEELDKYRRMDDATLTAARAISGHLGHEFASNDEGTVFMSFWENDEAVAQWAQPPPVPRGQATRSCRVVRGVPDHGVHRGPPPAQDLNQTKHLSKFRG